MHSIKINLKKNSYKILVGNHILGHLGKYLKTLSLPTDALIITNWLIHKLHGRTLVSGLENNGFTAKVFCVPDGEKSKSAKIAFSLLNKIASYDAGRKIFIIAFGGGVVGDLAGFVASCYKRGVPYVQVPTTLLAQIDSAIGGKTGLDLPTGKNLVGAFYQPRLVFSDVGLLTTLSSRQLRNGLAEAIKYGMIADKNFFEFLEKKHQQILSLDSKSLTYLVFKCAGMKADVIHRDEKETQGIRTILNFGHTLGHAIEAASRYNQYQHGEAIAIGMGMAADISQKMGFLKEEDVVRLKQLISSTGLPVRLKGLTVNSIQKMMRHDKKFLGRKNRFVLAYGIGRVKVVEGIPLEVVAESIRACME